MTPVDTRAPKLPRMPGIDGLRAVAVIAVFVYHYRDWSRLKQALAGVPLVVLVNVRVGQGWQGQVNGALREAVRGWRHATVADWYDVSARPGAVVDGTHTSPDGARLLAALLARTLRAPRLGGITR